MKVNTSKSKNAESFYIKQSYIDSNGKSTSRTIRKLGTLEELLKEHGPTRDDVMKWAREQARIETEKYEQEKENHCLPVIFHPNRKIPYGERRKFDGGYLFLQSIYHELRLPSVCRKIREKHHYEYDLNAILSDLVYTRVLDPGSKCSSYKAARKFLEPPMYELHDVYRALSVLAEESDFIQSAVYKNSLGVIKRNNHVLYYDCTNYYFEIEQEDGDKKYGKSKEHRPNPIIQMGLFTDGDGIPLAFSLFPGSQNEQRSLKPLEKKVIEDFGCGRFIFCSDAGLASENNRILNHSRDRAFIVTQPIKKLSAEYRELALNRKRFRRLSDHKLVDLDHLTDDDSDQLFYKEEPYSSKKLEQRLIITYSPKYADYYGTYRAMEKAVRAGKVRAIGVSNFYPDRFVDLAENVEIKPAVNQLKTNVFSQQWDSEREMEQYGTKIMAWAPIAQADADLFENPTLQAIAESHGRTVAQVALRYLIQRGIIAIPKTTHIDRMKENLDIFDFELSAAEMDSIRPLDRPREFQGSHRDPELVRFLLDYDKKFNPANK